MNYFPLNDDPTEEELALGYIGKLKKYSKRGKWKFKRILDFNESIDKIMESLLNYQPLGSYIYFKGSSDYSDSYRDYLVAVVKIRPEDYEIREMDVKLKGDGRKISLFMKKGKKLGDFNNFHSLLRHFRVSDVIKETTDIKIKPYRISHTKGLVVEPRTSPRTPISINEAFKILRIDPKSKYEDIFNAYHILMKYGINTRERELYNKAFSVIRKYYENIEKLLENIMKI
jgi:hypothetical protein